jgi:putative ABC transport system permease protein
MDTLLQDIRYAFRMLLKHRGFAATAVVVLGLGIGANTAIFSLVRGVLLRPLPYPNADRILYFEANNRAQGIRDSNVSIPDFEDWSKQEDLFADTAAYATGGAILTSDNAEPERVPRTQTTSSFFRVIGAQPILGRAFLPEEDKDGAELVAVLSDRLWKRRFNSDRNVIGRKITINARPMTIVGVMPPGFDYPEQSQIWLTLHVRENDKPRDNRSYSAMGRLKPGVPLERAQTQISAINAQLSKQFPDTSAGWDAKLWPLQDRLVRQLRPSLLVLLGAVALVLLIACANVANLLLARSAARQKEIAIRRALGAARFRIVRQLMTESVLLALLGGTVGLLLSIWLTDLLIGMNPADAPLFGAVRLDSSIFVFTLLISCATGALFGLAPSMQGSHLDVSASLKEGGRAVEGYRRTNARSLLLIGEVALSLMLLVGAGLLIKSFLRLQNVQPGFDPKGVLIASISLPSAKYPEETQQVQFYHDVIERLQKLPGVEAVAAGVNLPLGASDFSIGRSFIPEGRPKNSDESRNASYSVTTPDYFRALRIPLISGRAFNERDTATSPKVAIVNKTLATRIFGSPEAAIDKRISIWRDEDFAREIVGVVGDAKTSGLDQENDAQIYVPHPQEPWSFMTLVVRTAGDPASLAPAVRREVLAVDKEQPLFNVQTMEEAVSKTMATRRVSVIVFSFFAGTALLLAAIGIYGVMAYSVSQRTQEIGIRMALGAQTGDVLRMVVRQGMTLTLIGVVAGLGGALALTRILANLLFGVGATDPATFTAISLLLTFVALLACYLPARRAAKLNPVIALTRG